MKTIATKSWSDMDKESFRLKRINIGVCSAKAPERLEPKADDVSPPWIVTVSPKSSLGTPSPAHIGPYHSMGVAPFLSEAWRLHTGRKRICDWFMSMRPSA
jgi:hypothetical protein